jgi:hypothetical protein
MSESFHVSFTFSGPVVLKKKIFKWPYPIFIIFVIISSLKRTWSLRWTNLNYLCLRIICTKCDWIWLCGSGEYYQKFSVYFYYFAIISPWRRVSPFIWTNLNPPPSVWFVVSLVRIDTVVLEKMFKWPQPNPIFYIFLIISPLKRSWPFIWTNLNSLYPKKINTKSGWNWPSGSEDDF